MIRTKQDLKMYLKEDAKNYPPTRLKDKILKTPKYMIHKYLIFLRYSEYYMNIRYSFFNRLMVTYFRYRMRKLSYKLGFQIAENVFGPGINIYSYGTIITNPNAKVGAHCTIYPGVTLGGKVENGYPIIGDNCFIGLGSKILGGIRIGDNVYIAPNAVVVKSVEDNCVVGGVPAKVIKKK